MVLVGLQVNLDWYDGTGRVQAVRLMSAVGESLRASSRYSIACTQLMTGSWLESLLEVRHQVMLEIWRSCR